MSSRESTKSVNQGYLWMADFGVIFNILLLFILAIPGLYHCQIHSPLFSTFLCDPGSVSSIGHISQLSCLLAGCTNVGIWKRSEGRRKERPQKCNIWITLANGHLSQQCGGSLVYTWHCSPSCFWILFPRHVSKWHHLYRLQKSRIYSKPVHLEDFYSFPWGGNWKDREGSDTEDWMGAEVRMAAWILNSVAECRLHLNFEGIETRCSSMLKMFKVIKC